MANSIEDRVTRLETFMGNIDKITSVYANTIEEICNRWLNILYIENPQTLLPDPSILYINGFLTELTTVDDLPHNTMFYVRPSHHLSYLAGSTEAAKIRFKRDNTYIELPLKKYKFEEIDGEMVNHLVDLEAGDYLAGVTYMLYIDSQNIAVLSASDIGSEALSLVQQLKATVDELEETVEDLGNSQSITNLQSDAAEIGTLTITQALSLQNASALNLPTGSTISGEPTIGTHIVNKDYVDTKIWSEIMRYHSTYHLFGIRPAQDILSPATVPEGALYYKYPES